ncbi:MAG: lysine--tRNA ligase [Phycisphaera sp.]|nr:lysine--tRNA ligase [Phycisphaera sp.]
MAKQKDTSVTESSKGKPQPDAAAGAADDRAGGNPEADRRVKIEKLRDEIGIDPFGRRVDGIVSLDEARGRYDKVADEAQKADPADDRRPVVRVAGRVVLHRDIGKLVFMTLRDATGDLQVAANKRHVAELNFKLAKIADIGDVVVAEGPLAATKTGEITVWATSPQMERPATPEELSETKLLDYMPSDSAVPYPNGFEIACKSLAPPPSEHYGLNDPEVRYRKRYMDLYANPDVMATFQKRSRIIKAVRDFLTNPPEQIGPGFLEVETPMMQSIPGGAAARPFTTHHNALDIDLFLRIAPELYLKRLLVGGMPRVFEINRNFRNEGIDRSHNPEFTMLELYQAFGDYNSMMQITETLIQHLAVTICGSAKLPYGDMVIDYTAPFQRAPYHALFEQYAGFPSDDDDKLSMLAMNMGLDVGGKDHDVVLNEVWEQLVEPKLVQPTFVIDYPASLCPLTRQKVGQPQIAERFELFIANMELANAYTELNDPDIQKANFEKQVKGIDDEEQTFRNMDHDFVESLRVGMPPAGGLGIGIDRLVMLLTNSRSIRDVILFPLMRPTAGNDQ